MQATDDETTLRPAREDDRAAIAALHASSWKEAYRDVLPAGYLAGPIDGEFDRHWAAVDFADGMVLLAERERRLTAFVAIWFGPEVLIDNLHVAAASRSRGLGRELLRFAATRLLELGRTRAHLWVVASNHRAITFYERLGGVHTATGDEPMGGVMVPCRRYDWSDVAVLRR